MKRVAILLGLCILMMVPTLMASPQKSLQVRTGDGELMACLAVDTDDMLQLQFTHSMYGGYVREQWQVTPGGQLSRIRFVTEHAAAAEYYASDGSSYKADDGYVVPGAPLQQPELVVRVNNRGNHILTVDGETLHLAEMIPGSTQVRIFVDSGSCD